MRGRTFWGLFAMAGLVIVFPHLPFVPYSVLGKVNIGSQYALVAISLVVLTGWSGNISLGHSAFVGVGAYITGLLIQLLHIPFPVNLVWAGLSGALIAALLGIFALRIRGLYLAVATLIFAWVGQEFLFRQRWFIQAGAVDIIPLGRPGTFPYFDWTQRTTFFYGAWATVIAVIYMCANLRMSKSGRALAAVRGSEVAAASLGIDVVRTKLMAFAVSGGIAGMAGNLVMIGQQVVTQDQFDVKRSLFFLSIAVVGGLQSLGGAVASALIFAGLDELFFQIEWLGGWLDITSTLLLAVTLLFFRGGIAALPGALNRFLESKGIHPAEGIRKVGEVVRPWTDEVRTWIKDLLSAKPKASKQKVSKPRRTPVRDLLRKLKLPIPAPVVRTEPPLDLFSIRLPGEGEAAPNGDATAAQADASPSEILGRPPSPNGSDGPATMRFTPLEISLPPERSDRRPLIEAQGVTVRFGGLTAVKDFSLEVREGEIVGLIGPNGAGKTTLFNSIAGLNVPAAGRIRLFGQDVTDLPVHKRAHLGVGRTFQAIQLFSDLSVFDNLLVATHMHNPTGLASHVFVTSRSLEEERRARAQVRRALQLLELGSYADRRVADLPFGVLRMVEVSRALVTGARVIMLDEPASGLDNTETDRLSDILRFVRSLGVTLLLIEHDVQMVTSVSDYMYVIERGEFLAEGEPDSIKRDPVVIAAYLGETPETEEQKAGVA